MMRTETAPINRLKAEAGARKWEKLKNRLEGAGVAIAVLIIGGLILAFLLKLVGLS